MSFADLRRFMLNKGHFWLGRLRWRRCPSGWYRGHLVCAEIAAGSTTCRLKLLEISCAVYIYEWRGMLSLLRRTLCLKQPKDSKSWLAPSEAQQKTGAILPYAALLSINCINTTVHVLQGATRRNHRLWPTDAKLGPKHPNLVLNLAPPMSHYCCGACRSRRVYLVLTFTP